MAVYVIEESQEVVGSKKSVSTRGTAVTANDKKGIISEVKKQLSDLDPMTKMLIISKVKRVINLTTAYVNSKPDVTETELFYIIKRAVPELSGLFDTLDAIKPLVEGNLGDKTQSELLEMAGILPDEFTEGLKTIKILSEDANNTDVVSDFVSQ